MDDEKISSSYSYEISKKILSKKNFIQNSLDEILNSLQNDYNTILHQKDIELALHKAKESDHIKDMKNLLNIKKDLIEALENETKNHKSALDMIEILEHERLELKTALDEILKRLETQIKTHETEKHFLEEKISQLEEKIKKLENYDPSMTTGKKLNAYTQTLKDDENQRLLQTLKSSSPLSQA